tara:strand:- start:8 stop:211 length:204 start_codon:yes stop_codon:yes gene_type:complete
LLKEYLLKLSEKYINIETGIKEYKYLYPYEEAVEVQIKTVEKTWVNEKNNRTFNSKLPLFLKINIHT